MLINNYNTNFKYYIGKEHKYPRDKPKQHIRKNIWFEASRGAFNLDYRIIKTFG